MTHPTWHGVTVCGCIIESGPLAERRLREAALIKQDLSGLIMQGCYSGGAVDASKGTHDGGGVLDIANFTPYHEDFDNVLTPVGWIFVFRPEGSLYPGSPAHWHGLLNGCPHLSQAAKNQLVEFLAGRNGLAGKGKDSGPLPSLTWQQALAADSGAGTPPAPTPKGTEMDLIKHVTHEGGDRTKPPTGVAYYARSEFAGLVPVSGGSEAFIVREFATLLEFDDHEIDAVTATAAAIADANLVALAKVIPGAGGVSLDGLANKVADVIAARMGA